MMPNFAEHAARTHKENLRASLMDEAGDEDEDRHATSGESIEEIAAPTESVLNKFLKNRNAREAKQPDIGEFKNGNR